jgi:1-acyl-sn-glycerol-3-phosphate acyltransferase
MSQSLETSPTRSQPDAPTRDRPLGSLIWYRAVQAIVTVLLSAFFGLRATGRRNLPASGAALLVSNHLSHLDSFILGILLPRPLNYVARSTLFVPGVGAFIRSLGGFPIQREGLGASGMKETLRRLRAGGIVALFPEGTRTYNGELGEIKPGISLIAARAKVPIVPTAIAGTFEAWPRRRLLPRPHPIRIHFGTPISVEEISSLSSEAVTDLIRTRLLECQKAARAGLSGDL